MSKCKCGNKKHNNAIQCLACKVLSTRDKYSTLTIGDKIYTQHKYAKYQFIRYWARKILEESGITSCSNCPYDKHFEACHIKSISSFPKDTLLSVINDKSNLIALCPNCHWEFDNLNKIKQINICINCSNEVKVESIRCRSCNAKLRESTKSKRPTKEQLEQDLIHFNNNMCAIGRKYQVSDNAVRKWIKYYN